MAEQKQYPAGAIVFQEGTLHNAVHLITAGHIQLDVMIPQRGRVPVLTIGPGELLGWTPLFGHSPMTATATAVDNVETLAIPADALSQLCDAEPQVGVMILRRLALGLSRRLVSTRLELCNAIS